MIKYTSDISKQRIEYLIKEFKKEHEQEEDEKKERTVFKFIDTFEFSGPFVRIRFFTKLIFSGIFSLIKEFIKNPVFWKQEKIKDARLLTYTPTELNYFENMMPSGFKLFLGLIIFMLLWPLVYISVKFRLWIVTIQLSKLLIYFDKFRFEQKACGLNRSWTLYGYASLKLGRLEDALHCLKESWRVYPCPHNMSYGLDMRLSKLMDENPLLVDETEEYKEMNHLFRSVTH